MQFFQVLQQTFIGLIESSEGMVMGRPLKTPNTQRGWGEEKGKPCCIIQLGRGGFSLNSHMIQTADMLQLLLFAARSPLWLQRCLQTGHSRFQMTKQYWQCLSTRIDGWKKKKAEYHDKSSIVKTSLRNFLLVSVVKTSCVRFKLLYINGRSGGVLYTC